LTGLFRQSVTAWRSIVGLSDEAAAEMIREDRIDILVDLSGHTAGNRLLVFARKPAPIQITAWGYATGTGMRAMDVFFTDPVMVPQQEKQYFTEEVRYLPNVVGAFFNEPFPDVNELPALSDGITTFGSFNRLTKISAEAYRVWAEVLLAVPRSRLILKTGELDDAAVRERVVGHFTKAGVAADRIIMQGKSSWYEHMQAYNQIDIALDPFPHGGGVTALEGLMMGVPVITLRWPTVVGRLSASIMTTLGLTDWIAETQEQYVELAIQKATDLQSLAELRQQLRGIFTSSVIGDQVAYARAVEQEYRQLWREWCSPVEDYSDLR
jgi:protein O-GlcNAc transferase